MKKILFILLTSLLFAGISCSDVDIDIDPAHELADITTISFYVLDPAGVEDFQTPLLQSVTIVEESLIIDEDARTVTVQLPPDVDITQLKLVLGLSNAARVTPVIEGLQDMSQPRVFTVISANGTVTKEWTIIVNQ